MKYDTTHLAPASLTLAQTGSTRGYWQEAYAEGGPQMAYHKPEVAILGDAVTLVQAVKVIRIDADGHTPGLMP